MYTNRKRLTAALGIVAVSAISVLLPAMRADAETTASRIAGDDRYATAAAISAQAFSPGVSAVYLATGVNFPDALAGGAAAAKADGPVLLTQAGSLPSATATELDRLNPGKIVVLGGTGVVSDAVMTAVDQYTDGTVTRVSGTDRYDTAAKLSASVFPVDVHTVYVTTGVNFPDALAGGPAAGTSPSGGGPLLLVQQSAIPSTTATELTRLSAQRIVVLGGTQAVSESVVTALDQYSTDPVTRIAGADRFITSVGVSAASFPTGATKVYLATGRNFPDALAGGAAAAMAPGPMLLTEADCIPPEVNAEITRLDPTNLIVLGGTTAISNAVMSRTVCQPPASTTTSSIPTFQGAVVGEECSPANMPGVTSGGQPVLCSTTACDGGLVEPPKWRALNC